MLTVAETAFGIINTGEATIIFTTFCISVSNNKLRRKIDFDRIVAKY